MNLVNSQKSRIRKRSSHGKQSKRFKFEGPVKRDGPLSVVPVSVEGRRELKTLLDACIITVPKSCGTAVKRNKLRRLLKEHLRQHHAILLEKNTIWIRVSRDYKIANKLDRKYWTQVLDGLVWHQN